EGLSSRAKQPPRSGRSTAGFSLLGAEMLRQFEPLVLIAGGRTRAIELVRSAGEFFVHQASDRLAVFQQKRHIAAAHFQDRARGGPPVPALPEARVEEAGVVNAKLPDRRVDRRHFGGEVGGYLHFLAGS